jgi:hypothetical protein
MADIGADQKLTLVIGCFRLCPPKRSLVPPDGGRLYRPDASLAVAAAKVELKPEAGIARFPKGMITTQCPV